MQLSHYVTTFPCPDKPGRLLLLATRRCAVMELSDELWQRVRDGGEMEEEERETLQRLGVLVEDREAEKEEMRETFTRINKESRHLAVVVALTMACNLACPYCFEAPFRGEQTMDDAIADLLIRRLNERMAQGLDLTVDFYGGEALLQLTLLKRIATALQRAAGEHGVTFQFNIFSNGTLLTRPVVEELLPLGLAAVRLTLDGPPDIHDSQRPFVSGQESFATIMENIRAIHDILPIDLGGNYTRENYRRFPELLDLLIAEGIDPARFKAVGFSPVVPRADGSVAGDLGSACLASGDSWTFQAGLFLRAETIRRSFPVPKLKAGACVVEFENDLVVNWDGGIYKCPIFMGDESLKVGSLAEGINDYRESHNLDLWKNEECLECAYLPLCFGGCRFLARLKTGTMDCVDCRKELLDATLETIIRQDLGLDR
ncbi:geopeptide radical SAM maturase [Pelobacter propionicus]|uniref:Radical SAM domain protein n=1 Tax=Pelobacter propionicus (strain DSM 2379 / NBRC 103807 / OttBd1) TaxID=338966 RepID=A1ANQ2_PELPD|nr:geopeptide radical SAM maturase [Pelobacter propionicus]ABK98972.1 Radical SAM domain protein [Pelobacter propionicus DSM 2379]